jgi:hypothetical protein
VHYNGRIRARFMPVATSILFTAVAASVLLVIKTSIIHVLNSHTVDPHEK